MIAFSLVFLAAMVSPPAGSTVFIELTAEPAAVTYAREHALNAKRASRGCGSTRTPRR